MDSDDYIDCPCCGDVAAQGLVHDGQALACGCKGCIMLDPETDPYAHADDCDCEGNGRTPQTGGR